MDPKPITLYEWIIERFTIAGRAEFVEQLAPTFEQLVEPRAQVLDLCCGAGPFSFLFERLGADVTGLDNAPFMIDLARQEAGRRGSSVEFVLADVLEHDLRPQHYDLVAFIGNTVSDFSLEAAVRLVEKVQTAVRPGGRFVGAPLALEQSIRLSERSFLDVFRSPAAPLRPVRQPTRGKRPRDQAAG
jgi:SAM-dependent methyltransferase